MQAMPLFLGACALASIAGVVSGTAINTTPIQRAGIGMNEISRPHIDFASDNALREQVALPDHYAIETPEGRVDVAELSTRGIYAQRRFGWREAQWTPPPEPAFSDPPQSEWAPRGNELDRQDPASADAPVDADQSEDAPVEGGPRLIDVQTELANS